MKAIGAMRFFFVFLAFVTCAAGAQAAGYNPRYAGLVVEADTGNVLYADHANDKRYPASLTKLMTLYLAFEALRDGKISMDTVMTASKKAASMPQTNISLRPGDKISVRDAVSALVVHSANDVAVVFAEHLGGSEWAFGSMMTQKARQLGMNSTVFRNASGLPDNAQYTSARDMAVLAMAIRKQFPQYYPLFKNSQFTYKGRTYYTHNRVTQRLPGAEGLKTGYINASGFNLVTTVSRSGKTLVGVVMGGRTAATRDNHMISLIERSYAQLDKGLATTQYASASVPAIQAQRHAFRKVPAPSEKPAILLAKNNQVAPAAVALSVVATEPKKPVEVASAGEFTGQFAAPAYSNSALQAQNAVARVAPQMPFAEARGQFNPVAYNGRDWGIQVGAYNKAPEALMAAINASKMANTELSGAQVMVLDAEDPSGNGQVHRARLANMDEDQARRACQKLVSLRQSCFVVRMNQGESL